MPTITMHPQRFVAPLRSTALSRPMVNFGTVPEYDPNQSNALVEVEPIDEPTTRACALIVCWNDALTLALAISIALCAARRHTSRPIANAV